MSNKLMNFKLVLLGDAAVGKSSCVERSYPAADPTDPTDPTDSPTPTNLATPMMVVMTMMMLMNFKLVLFGDAAVGKSSCVGRS
jgi:GTPase SAR1 family protein